MFYEEEEEKKKKKKNSLSFDVLPFKGTTEIV